MAAMADDMASLKLQVARLFARQSSSHRLGHSGSRPPPDGLYHFHAKFGTEAYSLSLNLTINLRRYFSWIFVMADVPDAILGADFLTEFDLLVDCHRFRLLDRSTGLCVRGLTP
ncbi:unnamed protein product, partial [Dibothriocephalus latus]